MKFGRIIEWAGYHHLIINLVLLAALFMVLSLTTRQRMDELRETNTKMEQRLVEQATIFRAETQKEMDRRSEEHAMLMVEIKKLTEKK